MNTIKKLICLSIVLTMTFSFSSCGDKKTEQPLSHDISSSMPDTKKTNKTAPKITEYYDEIPVNVPDYLESVGQVKYSNDKLYVTGRSFGDNNYSVFSTDISTLETVQIQDNNKNEDDHQYEEIYEDKKGNTYKCYGNKIEIYNSKQKLIKTLDRDFYIDHVDINELYFYSSTVSENGDIYIAASIKTPESIQIIKVNSSFEIEYVTEKGTFSDCGYYIRKIMIGTDGNIILCTESDMTYINVLSPDSGSTLLRYQFPVVEQIIGSYGNNNIIYRNGNTIYAYDFINDSTTELYSADNSEYEILNADIKNGELITKQIKKDESNNVLSIMTCDGKSEKRISIPGKYLPAVNITSDGTVYLLNNNLSVEYTDDGPFETSQPEILRVKEDGTLETIYKGQKNYSEKNYGFAADSKGNICFSEGFTSDINNGVHLTYISCTGEKTDIAYDTIGYVSSIVCLNDVFHIELFSSEDFSKKHYTVDKENMTINQSKDINVPLNSVIDGNSGFDFYYLSDGTVYGYHMEDDSSEKIFSWFDTGVACIPENFNQIAVVSPGNVFYFTNNPYDFENAPEIKPVSLFNLKKADQARLNELNSRKVITVAGVNLDENYFEKITQFNKNNNDYMVIPTDYSLYETDTSGDDSQIISRFQTDVAQGNIPDVILGERSFDIQSLLGKDELADLNGFIKNDQKKGDSDFAQNVLDACTYNGKLYSIPYMMSLDTITIPKECVENKDMLTYEEFFDLSEKFSKKILTNSTREKFFGTLVSSYISDNVNFKKATCSFETDTFKKILELSKKCHTEEDYISQGCYDPEGNYPQSDCLFRINTVNYLFFLYNGLTDTDSHEVSYSLKGIPSSSGITSLLNIDSYLCIINSSENKDGAWKFIKYFINTDDQKTGSDFTYMDTISVSSSKNQKTINNIISRISQDSNSKYYKSDIEMFKKEINCLCNGKFFNDINYSGIYSIVNEEANSFFENKASVDQTVSAIQSKVKLYLSEL